MLIGLATHGGYFVRDMKARETVFRANTVRECEEWCRSNRPNVPISYDDGVLD